MGASALHTSNSAASGRQAKSNVNSKILGPGKSINEFPADVSCRGNHRFRGGMLRAVRQRNPERTSSPRRIFRWTEGQRTVRFRSDRPHLRHVPPGRTGNCNHPRRLTLRCSNPRQPSFVFSSSATPSWPAASATCTGVSPFCAACAGSAPCSRSDRTRSTSPFNAAT